MANNWKTIVQVDGHLFRYSFLISRKLEIVNAPALVCSVNVLFMTFSHLQSLFTKHIEFNFCCYCFHSFHFESINVRSIAFLKRISSERVHPLNIQLQLIRNHLELRTYISFPLCARSVCI